MNTSTRINILNKRIAKKIPSGDYMYWTMLMIDKDKPFNPDESKVNINQGDNYLGMVDFKEEPAVLNKIKQVYGEEQKKLKEEKQDGLSDTAIVFLHWIQVREISFPLI